MSKITELSHEQREGANWLKFWYNGYKNNGMTADLALRATIIDHANAEGFDPVILIKFLEEVDDVQPNKSS